MRCKNVLETRAKYFMCLPTQHTVVVVVAKLSRNKKYRKTTVDNTSYKTTTSNNRVYTKKHRRVNNMTETILGSGHFGN